MDLLIINTLSTLWRRLGGMRGRQGRIGGGCGRSEKEEKNEKNDDIGGCWNNHPHWM